MKRDSTAITRRSSLFGHLWQRIQDLPRHLGQHSGGMVMCQGRLDDVVPLENASMPDRVVIQWDKDDCADMGLIKVDLLGLGMMAVLQDALALVNESGTRDRGLGSSGIGDRGSGTGGSGSGLGTSDRVDWGPESPVPSPRAPVPRSSISPIFLRTIRRSTRCCRRRTPSASSRWNRARRWRRCRG